MQNDQLADCENVERTDQDRANQTTQNRGGRPDQDRDKQTTENKGDCTEKQVITTRSGRVVRKPTLLYHLSETFMLLTPTAVYV